MRMGWGGGQFYWICRFNTLFMMFNQAKDHLFEDVHVCSERSNLFLQGWQALIEKNYVVRWSVYFRRCNRQFCLLFHSLNTTLVWSCSSSLCSLHTRLPYLPSQTLSSLALSHIYVTSFLFGYALNELVCAKVVTTQWSFCCDSASMSTTNW